MSKRAGMPDLMQQAMTGASTPSKTVSGIGDLKAYSMRLPEGVVEQLRAHFASRGLSLSAGVRSWLIERMEREGLR